MSAPDMDVIKDIPGYKVILKAVLKSQIQQLVEQLASVTEEESVLLTASVSDGTLSHLGSSSGKTFLEDHEDIKSQFLGFCLKRHHVLKQQEKEKQDAERLAASSSSSQYGDPSYMSGRLPRFSSPRQQGLRPVALRRAGGQGVPVRGPPGMRHSPYSMQRPPRRPSFDQQGPGRSIGSGSQTSTVSMSTSQVIKIEAEDDTVDGSNLSVGDLEGQTNVQTSSHSVSPSPDTGSNVHGDSSDKNDAVGAELSPAIGVVTEQRSGEISDSQDGAGTDTNVTSGVQDQNLGAGTQSGDGIDPNVSVKLEAITDAEMELEITGVEPGNVTAMPSGSQDWGQEVAMGYDMGAAGNQGDLQSGEQGYSMMASSQELSTFKQDTPFTCCGRDFVNSVNLRLHRTNIHGENNGDIHGENIGEACRICGKKFSKKKQVLQHIKVVHSDCPFKCETCGLTFKSKLSLADHLDKHMGEKTHRCYCGKEYQYATPMTPSTENILSFTEEFQEMSRLPYVTGTDFNVSNSADMDIVLVGGRKQRSRRKFECDICRKSFRDSYGLSRHTPLHTGEKKFECTHCEYKTHRKDHLQGHVFLHLKRKV